MVNIENPSPPPPAGAAAHNGHAGPSAVRMLGAEIGGLFESFWRIADIQVHVWVASVKSAASRIIVASVFGAISIVLIIVAAIFGFASVFHFLTDYLNVPTAWALLIFAGVFGLGAMVLVLMSVRTLKHNLKGEDA